MLYKRPQLLLTFVKRFLSTTFKKSYRLTSLVITPIGLRFQICFFFGKYSLRKDQVIAPFAEQFKTAA